MNAVTEIPRRPSVLESMAERYGMTAPNFEATVRETCMPTTRDGKVQATREEFAAFLLVAREYKLNPLTREIYAFPRKGGGIVPIVSVDGWVSLVNSHDACDGFEFDYDHDDKGALVSCTCRMYRKDRGRPVIITEYLSECRRDTDPWKMQHRMLRHKAMIQAARYAFGFSGIYDEDEGAAIADMRDVTPPSGRRGPPPAPLAPSGLPGAVRPEEVTHYETGAGGHSSTAAPKDAGAVATTASSGSAPASDLSEPTDAEFFDPKACLAELKLHLSECTTLEHVDNVEKLFEEDLTQLRGADSEEAMTLLNDARGKATERAAHGDGGEPAVPEPERAEASHAPNAGQQRPTDGQGAFSDERETKPKLVDPPTTADEYEALALHKIETASDTKAISAWFRETAELRDKLAMPPEQRQRLVRARNEKIAFLSGQG